MARMKTEFGLRDLVLIATLMVSISVFVTKIDAMTSSLRAVVDGHEGRITELEKCELRRQGYEQAMSELAFGPDDLPTRDR